MRTAHAAETLLELFTRYNLDWWPAHLVTYAAGVAVAVAAAGAQPSSRRSRVPSVVLGVLLVWLGIVFQGAYATDVSLPLGVGYAVLFVAGGVMLVVAAARGRVEVSSRPGTLGWLVGWAALGYALVVYPMVGAALGHGWPESPLFGMAPCPTVIALFGVLAMSAPAPRSSYVLPVLWTLLATLPAVGRGVWEDLGMVVFGIASVAVLVRARSAARHAGSARTSATPVATP